jgi:hypothetical protein
MLQRARLIAGKIVLQYEMARAPDSPRTARKIAVRRKPLFHKWRTAFAVTQLDPASFKSLLREEKIFRASIPFCEGRRARGVGLSATKSPNRIDGRGIFHVWLAS